MFTRNINLTVIYFYFLCTPCFDVLCFSLGLLEIPTNNKKLGKVFFLKIWETLTNLDDGDSWLIGFEIFEVLLFLWQVWIIERWLIQFQIFEVALYLWRFLVVQFFYLTRRWEIRSQSFSAFSRQTATASFQWWVWVHCPVVWLVSTCCETLCQRLVTKGHFKLKNFYVETFSNIKI